MQCTTKLRITELNPHLLCVLCGGYYIDATAIIECLHSFCKSCIIRYLETHKYCPICDVLVHKTNPLQNIRPDKILQSIVYKLVPNLYHKEMCNRRKFYVSIHPHLQPDNTELKGEITESSSFYSMDDIMNLSLEYINYLGDQNYFFVASSSKRYISCQAKVTLNNLRELLSAKYSLSSNHEIRFFLNGIQLPEHLKLLDIAYMSSWKRKECIRLLYQILEIRKTIIQAESKPTTVTTLVSSSKESEPVSLSVDDNTADDAKGIKINNYVLKTEPVVPSTTILNNLMESTSVSDRTPDISFTPSSVAGVVPISSSSVTDFICPIKSTSDTSDQTSDDNNISDSCNQVKNDKGIIEDVKNDETILKNKSEIKNSVYDSVVSDDNNAKSIPNNEIIVSNDVNKVDKKDKAQKQKSTDIISSKLVKIPKLENNAESETYVSKTDQETSSYKATAPISNTKKITTNAPIQIISNHSSSVSTITNDSITKAPLKDKEVKLTRDIEISKPEFLVSSSPVTVGRASPLPIGKISPKSLKTYSRPWSSSNSMTVQSIKQSLAAGSKATSSSLEAGESVQKSVKFFKSHNAPRFLGNPASGIRPMFEISTPLNVPAKAKSEIESTKPLKNVSVLKIDPKTLSPIVTTPLTASASLPSSSSSSASISKKSFSYAPSIPKHSTSLSSFNSSTNKSSALMYQHNSLLSSVNPLLYGIYPNYFANSDLSISGPTSLDFMKAMSNLYSSSTFHPSLSSSFNMLFNPHHKPLKYDKMSKNSSKSSSSSIHRSMLSPSSIFKNAKTSSISDRVDSISSSSDLTRDSLLNGHSKTKNKKSENSFSINNLLPMEEAKHAKHSCSADGINQICDQLPSNQLNPKIRDEKVKDITEKLS